MKIKKFMSYVLPLVLMGMCIVSSFTFKKHFFMKTKVRTLICHKVENFEKWKQIFEANQPLRKAAGELSYEIGTLDSDPATVYIFNEWVSEEVFMKFIQNPDLQNAMKTAGVIEKPQIFVLNKTKGNSIGNENVKSLIMHQVSDFKKWLSVFESAQSFRSESGEISYELGQLGIDEFPVFILNEWKSKEAMQNFLRDPKLMQAMKDAGVLTPPQVLVFNRIESGNL